MLWRVQEPIDRVNDFKTTMSQGYRIDYIDTLPADWQKTYTISGTKAFQQPGKISGSVSYTIPSEAEVVGFNLIPGKEVGHIDTYVKLTVGESGPSGPETAVYEGEANPALTETGPVVPGSEVEGSSGVEFECGSTANTQRDESSEMEDFKETSVQTEDLGVVVGETRALQGPVKPANLVLLREDGSKIATDVTIGFDDEGQDANFTNDVSGDNAGDPSLVGKSYMPKGLFMLKDTSTGNCLAFKSGNLRAPLVQKSCNPNGKLTVWETRATKNGDETNLLKLKVDDKKLFVDTPGNEDTAKHNKIQAWNASMGAKDQQVKFSYLGENDGNAVVAIHAGDEPDLVYTTGADGITRALPWQDGVTSGFEIVPIKQVVISTERTTTIDGPNFDPTNGVFGPNKGDKVITVPVKVKVYEVAGEETENADSGDDDESDGIEHIGDAEPEIAGTEGSETVDLATVIADSLDISTDGPPEVTGGDSISVPPTEKSLLRNLLPQSGAIGHGQSANQEDGGAPFDDEVLESIENAAAEEAGWAAAQEAFDDASL
eukprot:tig00021221_g19344.t1